MKRFKNILYVNTKTADQASAISRAVTLAVNNQSKLTMIEVIPQSSDTVNSHKKALQSLVKPYQERLAIDIHVLIGTPFLEVIRTVVGNGHDLVIKLAENPDFVKKLFGSDDLHLLRKCPCPVWLMKPPEKSKYNDIAAAVGFNPLKPDTSEEALNLKILELASSLALTDRASLHIIHAWDAYAESSMIVSSDIPKDAVTGHVETQYAMHQKELYRLWAKMRERIGDDAYFRLVPRIYMPKGPAKQMIATLADELQADLVVMGTVARTGISGLIMGNTAEAIVDQLSCSLLAIKPEGFATPMKHTA